MRETIQGGKGEEVGEAAPEDGDPGWAVGLAAEVATKGPDPGDGLGEGGRGGGQDEGLRDVAIPGLPLAFLQQEGTGEVDVFAGQQGGEPHLPGDDAEDGPAALRVVEILELALFEGAA